MLEKKRSDLTGIDFEEDLKDVFHEYIKEINYVKKESNDLKSSKIDRSFNTQVFIYDEFLEEIYRKDSKFIQFLHADPFILSLTNDLYFCLNKDKLSVLCTIINPTSKPTINRLKGTILRLPFNEYKELLENQFSKKGLVPIILGSYVVFIKAKEDSDIEVDFDSWLDFKEYKSSESNVHSISIESNKASALVTEEDLNYMEEAKISAASFIKSGRSYIKNTANLYKRYAGLNWPEPFPPKNQPTPLDFIVHDAATGEVIVPNPNTNNSTEYYKGANLKNKIRGGYMPSSLISKYVATENEVKSTEPAVQIKLNNKSNEEDVRDSSF